MLEHMSAAPELVGTLPAVRVLVVDDDFDSADLLATLLGAAGCECRTALGAGEALDVVQSFSPQFAVLDLAMPGVDGYELLGCLRSRHDLQDCRFIALTGYRLPELAERSLAAGFELHLTKPVPMDLLLQRIAQH